jgi:hypothetical protein
MDITIILYSIFYIAIYIYDGGGVGQSPTSRISGVGLWHMLPNGAPYTSVPLAGIKSICPSKFPAVDMSATVTKPLPLNIISLSGASSIGKHANPPPLSGVSKVCPAEANDGSNVVRTLARAVLQTLTTLQDAAYRAGNHKSPLPPLPLAQKAVPPSPPSPNSSPSYPAIGLLAPPSKLKAPDRI